ncbi:hypothetical protein PP740_gp023 [Stenotrophomonas phage Philippe]|uniref:Uncharacterized protein n=1 Tax=Stenotrophomonas phage Philippe TaxID=2859655 RepID=A0AAE7WMT7_9CAUD|nr:hypothetical protein PP740_gp023 [Stenotrophomonas phage Philippe]QYW02222.1 hypothetical protein CPT_Philippe_023 [Stenotrophomonas phage Philippe]
MNKNKDSVKFALINRNDNVVIEFSDEQLMRDWTNAQAAMGHKTMHRMAKIETKVSITVLEPNKP